MRRLFLIAFAVIGFAACSDNDDNNAASLDEQLLLGTWVLNEVDGEALATNECFVCEYTTEGQNYSMWCDLDGENSSWTYKSLTQYSVIDDVIYLKSDADDIRLQTTIVEGDPDTISWRELYNVEEGEDLNQNRTFSGYRTTIDYSNEITNGVWEGRATEGREVNPYLRIEYYSDGTYDFQSRENLEDDWSEKSDNDGHYYLLGELLGSVWMNDINSDVEGSMSEAWIVSIEDDVMVWSATRDGGATERFEFTRISELE